jgi:hypothetical protein
MEIQWKHVFLFFAVILLLVNLGPIVNTLAGIISDVLAAIDKAFEPLRSYHYRGNSSAYALARLCVLLIFLVAVLKLIKGWNRKN